MNTLATLSASSAMIGLPQVPASIPRQGYFLETVSDAGFPALCEHRLCGANECEGATCPNCRLPLLQIASLDGKDERLDLLGAPLSRVPLLFCWRCSVSQGDFSYRLRAGGSSIEILAALRGKPIPDFPYPEYPESFPLELIYLHAVSEFDQAVLVRCSLGEDDYELFRRFPQLCKPKHQVGGVPFLFDAQREVNCPCCGGQAPLFAAFGDNAGHGLRFTGNDFVQLVFHLCRACRVIAAYQATD